MQKINHINLDQGIEVKRLLVTRYHGMDIKYALVAYRHPKDSMWLLLLDSFASSEYTYEDLMLINSKFHLASK